jgi:hypothetical protein
MIIIIIILFIILLITYYVLLKPCKKKASVAIVLTTCVNDDPKRKSIYVDRINKYLQFTKVNLYIVESSGYTFPEYEGNPRIKVYSFKGEKKGSSSEMELDSLTKIIDRYNLWSYDIVLKITGKYYVPNIEYIVNLITDDIDIVLQNTKNGSSQNSEIFGARPKYYKELNEFVQQKRIFEDSIPLLRGKRYRLPKIYLKDFTERGDGSVLKIL